MQETPSSGTGSRKLHLTQAIGHSFIFLQKKKKAKNKYRLGRGQMIENRKWNLSTKYHVELQPTWELVYLEEN